MGFPEIGSWELPRLALNCDPLNLCLLRSQDYRCETLAIYIFFKNHYVARLMCTLVRRRVSLSQSFGVPFSSLLLVNSFLAIISLIGF
jgi:hypothetical protein